MYVTPETARSVMTRKLRRARDSSQTSNDNHNNGGVSSYQLYEIQGDSSAALASFLEDKPTFATKYNSILLNHIVNPPPKGEDIMPKLQSLENEFLEKVNASDQSTSARKRKRNELILAYNRALVLHSIGSHKECLDLCIQKIARMIHSKKKVSEEQAHVTSRIGLLLIESFLALCMGKIDDSVCKQYNLYPISIVTDWLEMFNAEKDLQLKFLISLYKSRLDLSQLEDGKHSDANIRSARKELKSSMEVFQHRLRTSFGDTVSVVSSTNSEENSTTTNNQDQQQALQSIVLQKHHQAALTLKAHLEQLKANTKKSLILCSEALNATQTFEEYEAIHCNNLAVIYETNNKRQLALHALAKVLSRSQNGPNFYSDGTVRPYCTLPLLYNSAICALNTGNFASAYECMATCIVQSEHFQRQPRCWLRLAEACIGLYTLLPSGFGDVIQPVTANGQQRGALLNSARFANSPTLEDETLCRFLGSEDDFQQVRRNPLLRALASLKTVLSWSELDDDLVQATHMSLAYVHLARQDYPSALHHSQQVAGQTSDARILGDEIRQTTMSRRVAISRMYAAEASCGLGDVENAMKYVHVDEGESLDLLASEISGVTIDMASESGAKKYRLAEAQSLVRSSASVITAAMGDVRLAKKLAMSAQAMGDATSRDRERSSAHRALVYSLLRAGNSVAALKLLHAMRSR